MLSSFPTTSLFRILPEELTYDIIHKSSVDSVLSYCQAYNLHVCEDEQFWYDHIKSLPNYHQLVEYFIKIYPTRWEKSKQNIYVMLFDTVSDVFLLFKRDRLGLEGVLDIVYVAKFLEGSRVVPEIELRITGYISTPILLTRYNKLYEYIGLGYTRFSKAAFLLENDHVLYQNINNQYIVQSLETSDKMTLWNIDNNTLINEVSLFDNPLFEQIIAVILPRNIDFHVFINTPSGYSQLITIANEVL
jgi:hypothetical protein